MGIEWWRWEALSRSLLYQLEKKTNKSNERWLLVGLDQEKKKGGWAKEKLRAGEGSLPFFLFKTFCNRICCLKTRQNLKTLLILKHWRRVSV
jgi:hypothetical protein